MLKNEVQCKAGRGRLSNEDMPYFAPGSAAPGICEGDQLVGLTARPLRCWPVMGGGAPGVDASRMQVMLKLLVRASGRGDDARDC